MNEQIGITGIVTLLISSSALAALLSIAGNHLLARLQFKRDYYKELIAKRLHAYQQVDEIIGILRGTTYDDHGRIAHVVFLNRAVHERALLLVAIHSGVGLYMSEEVQKCLSEINFILLRLPANACEKEAFEIGVTYREGLLRLRRSLEFRVAEDLLRLYKVRQFLREKRRAASSPEAGNLTLLPKHGAFSFETHSDR